MLLSGLITLHVSNTQHIAKKQSCRRSYSLL
jgi:hypothetical protein